MNRPPKFVHGFIDRHGKPRFYFRRAGFKKVPLPGLPWSPAFMAVYEAAMAERPLEIGASRTKPGTIRALAVAYCNSGEFRNLRLASQRTYRQVIDRFCREHGDKGVATLQAVHVKRMMNERSPSAANHFRRALRAMMQHAVAIGLRDDDPTRDVRSIPLKGGGYHSWTEAEIRQFEDRHPIGTKARLAFALLLYSGQRRADVAQMGRQHIKDGAIEIRQQKTGREVTIPIHSELRPIIETATDMTFIVTPSGKPYEAASFGKLVRAWCNEAGLPHCSAHGLRKAAARRLAEAGCTAHEIAAITGHASLKEVERYTSAADRKRLARAAMQKAESGTSSVKPDDQFDKHAKKS
jgi:integrase